jgi:ATP-dependent DNA helicase DinG
VEGHPGMLRNHFPAHHEPRDQQAEALEILENSDKKFFIFEMPTGSGKSDIGYTVCAASGGHILTPFNTLAEQYMRDFEEFGLVDLKGKSHYHDDPDGPDCLTASASQNNHEVRCTTYYPRLRQFLGSGMSITNYANFLSHPKWPHRSWLVLDEGHNIESQILNIAGNVLTPSECASKYGLTLPIFKRSNEAQAREWLQAEYLCALAKRLDEIKSQLQEYKDAGDIPANDEANAKKLAKEQDAISRRQTALNVMLQGDREDWFLASDWKWDKNKGSGNLIIKPLNCAPYASKLFNRADKILIMSGTILSPDVFVKTLGIDPARIEFHAWNSSFPVANRPIHYQPIGKMTYPCLRQCRSKGCCQKQTLPRMVKRVVEIVASYPNVKGIVHTQSYQINERFADALIAVGFGLRVITHKNSEGRAEAEELHRADNADPTVLLSPGMTEGLDLVDELSRFQIITKVPYPFWGDPYIQARKGRSEEWYDWVTAVTLIQASGRSVRSMSDHADTFILDASFESFISKRDVRRLFPVWWLDAIEET